MQTIPTFIVGHMSGQNWDPVWREGRDLFSDVWFVARQAWYVREITARFQDHPAIAGWLLTNEVPIYGDWRSRGNDALDPDVVIAWAQILIDAVRAGGGSQPVTVGEGAWGVEITGRDNGFRVRDIARTGRFPRPARLPHGDGPVAAVPWRRVHLRDVAPLRQARGDGGVWAHLGLHVRRERRPLLPPAAAPHAARGATGWLAWNNTDYDDLYAQAPYTHRPFEQHFGLIDRHGVPKPQALEMRDFRALLDRIDGASLHPP